ncbi:imidazole glycerol phosphate synthase subunit HisF [Aureisphaera sp. CAU 1614]|uniref:Imidazole glycerol phosphate synthase subunit HisF n=1 Tax=Halomarinibacterium sedimenti TaxID=2857106 RepID=A0A9X1FQ81_9FLAO|nr:imidazole glycerol phosphate synthase subunit HisF [Halomarinibacterium sedimenti]MBW2938467.1 imidazole glycerol phosphate synthase subunit HisF [Halomarinibacterium sedimenti]
MLKKRIIPCLDIKNGRTVKGINFEGLRDAGDPAELAKRYQEEGADELVFLDISASEERRSTLVPLVKDLSSLLSIPFTVGGGIKSVEDVSVLLQAGADKVSINSAAVKNPILLKEISETFGSQCVVLAIDSKEIGANDLVFIQGGKVETSHKTLEWVKKGVALGAGEILLTSMGFDGTKKGFDTRLLNIISETVNVPVIASGGAGSIEDFSEVFKKTKVTGALAASIFHFKEIEISTLKNQLRKDKIPVR